MPTFLGHFVRQRCAALQLPVQQIAFDLFGGNPDAATELEFNLQHITAAQLVSLSDLMQVEQRHLARIKLFDDEWATVEVPLTMTTKIPGGGVHVPVGENVRTAAEGERRAKMFSTRLGNVASIIVHGKFVVRFECGRICRRTMILPNGNYVPLVIANADVEDDWLFDFDS